MKNRISKLSVLARNEEMPVEILRNVLPEFVEETFWPFRDVECWNVA